MQRWKNAFWISAGILALAALVGSVTPHAIAQIRAALVRDLDSPIRGTRVVINETITFGTSSFSITGNITPSIPAGKRLFLQSASVHTLLTDGQAPMEVRVSISGDTVAWVPQVLQAGASQTHFTGSAGINVLVNAGEVISVFAFRNNNLGGPSLNFTKIALTGYLVDANP